MKIIAYESIYSSPMGKPFNPKVFHRIGHGRGTTVCGLIVDTWWKRNKDLTPEEISRLDPELPECKRCARYFE